MVRLCHLLMHFRAGYIFVLSVVTSNKELAVRIKAARFLIPCVSRSRRTQHILQRHLDVIRHCCTSVDEKLGIAHG